MCVEATWSMGWVISAHIVAAVVDRFRLGAHLPLPECQRSTREVVYFESEQKARLNEGSQKHHELLGQMRALIDGQPEYVDLTPVQETSR